MATWVIVGAGYVGGALARRLAGEGDEIIVTRRALSAAEQAARDAGPTVRARALTLRPASSDAAGDSASLARAPFPRDAIVVCCAPPADDPAGEIDALVAAATEARRLVYVSSTGVYAPGGGAWVHENWPIGPVTASGRARVAAELALAAARIPTVALRVAGIHGPGRGLLDRIRAGTYRIVGDGRAHVSRIHVDDLVEAIVRAGRSSVGEAVNIADDDPAPIGVVADTIAAHLGLAPPPRVPADSVGVEIAGMLTADRKIANARMKDELGVTLRWPSWRTLLAAA